MLTNERQPQVPIEEQRELQAATSAAVNKTGEAAVGAHNQLPTEAAVGAGIDNQLLA